MMKSFQTFIVLILLVVGSVSAGEKSTTTKEVFSLIEKKDTSIVLLDVRTPAEYFSNTGHLRGAILLPVQELEERVSELQRYKKKTIITYCRTQNRSARAAEFLRKQGFNVLYMNGGITQWNREQLPVVKEVQR
jgi:rhodanese-related sulfurtransferase